MRCAYACSRGRPLLSRMFDYLHEPPVSACSAAGCGKSDCACARLCVPLQVIDTVLRLLAAPAELPTGKRVRASARCGYCTRHAFM